MSYEVFTSIAEIADEWDQLLPDVHSLRSVHLKILESSSLQDIRFYYVLICNEKKELVAIAYFQEIHFKESHYKFPVTDNFLLRKMESAVMKNGFHILVAGNLLRIDSPGIFYNPESISVQSVLKELKHFMGTLRPRPHAILYKDWNYPAEELIHQGYFQWEGDLTMKMKIDPGWSDFDGYIKSLRHRYAQRVRRARKKAQAILRKELSLEEISQYLDKIESLYLEVVRNQSIRMIVVTGEYFLKMKLNYGNKFRVFGYFKETELIAFSSNIIHNGLWELHYIGMGYMHNPLYWLYFNILYDAIEDAIRDKKYEIELGRTARKPKLTLGAFPVYFTSYARITGLLPRVITGLLRNNFNRKSEMSSEILNPLKKEDH